MGPLFSFALAITLGICLTMVCFAGAMFFLPIRQAAAVAVIATLGVGGGVVVAVAVAIPFVGFGETLNASSVVVRYLAALGCGGVLGGVAAATFYFRLVSGGGKHDF